VRGGDAGDQLGTFHTAQPTQRQQRRVRPRQPRGREFRPRGHHGKQSGRTDAVGQARHKFKRGGIDPVSVFQNQKHRIGLAEADELVDQEGNDRRLALRRRKRQRGRHRDCQQFRQQRNRGCVRRRPFGEQGAEFLDPRTWQVRGGEAGGATQMLDYRVKRAVAVIGRALQMDAGVRLGD